VLRIRFVDFEKKQTNINNDNEIEREWNESEDLYVRVYMYVDEEDEKQQEEKKKKGERRCMTV
jgi:hypothetical protein